MIYCANPRLIHVGTCALTISGISHFASGDVNIKVLIKRFQKYAMSPKVLQSKALGEEPLVAHGLLANHCADERNPLAFKSSGA